MLHTWGQKLRLHPNVHCIVPGGGLGAQGCWQKSRAGGDRFLCPVKAIWRVYRAIFMKKLCGALESGELVLPESEPEFYDPRAYSAWKNARYTKPWVVYAKRPFGGPKQVIEYLGRYTHKTAISNHRLLEVTDTSVRFSYKDYRSEGKKKEMTLDGVEFLRRFTMHFPPKGFRRMRHYGILSNAQKGKSLAACRQSLAPGEADVPKKTRRELRAAALVKLLDGRPANWCACCKSPTMVRTGIVPPQSLPLIYRARAPPGPMPHWQPTTDWTN